MGIWEISFFELIKAGGPIMVPIIICSIFSLAIVIEKMLYFSYINVDIPAFKTRIFELLNDEKFQEALTACEENTSPVAKILKAGIIKFGTSREEIKECLEDASLFEIPKIEKRLPALATIAHISPLLGLLGTVTGMASSFHTIQIQANSLTPVTPGDLAGGIWEALITTVAGLMVAIPTFVAYNYLASRVNGFVLEAERAATELLNVLTHLAGSRTTHQD